MEAIILPAGSQEGKKQALLTLGLQNVPTYIPSPSVVPPIRHRLQKNDRYADEKRMVQEGLAMQTMSRDVRQGRLLIATAAGLETLPQYKGSIKIKG